MKTLLLLGLLLLFSAMPVCAAETLPGPYTLLLPVATDGDTIKADVSVWLHIDVIDIGIRVSGIDTPELRSTAGRVVPPCEKSLAINARNFMQRWIDTHQPISITQIKDDKYEGRVDAVVMGRDGSLLSSALMAAGHARPYTGGRRLPWCE